MKPSLNFIFFCSLFVLVGCAEQSLEDRLLGSWQNKENNTKVVFMKNSNLILTREGTAVRGKYSVFEKDKMKITIKGISKEAPETTITVKIEGQKLLWKDSDGEITATYIRVQ
jgi:hypothetical protein